MICLRTSKSVSIKDAVDKGGTELLSSLLFFADEREEVVYYMERVSSRLATVELSVRTVRNQPQEECLHQVNVLIDKLINSQDMIMSRQVCQVYLNTCTDDAKTDALETMPIDKKFENALLGCTLDDQKETKKRLTALMIYFNKRTVCE